MAHPMTNVAPLEIGLCVADLEKSIAFYRDLLGFAEVSRIPTPAEFALRSGIAEYAYTVVRLQLPTGERLKLFRSSGPVDVPVPGTSPLSVVGLAFITLIVTNIQASVTHARQAGAAVRGDVVTLRPGVSVALVVDPDANVVELVEYADLPAYRDDLRGKESLA